MGSWAELNIGGQDVFHWKSEVDPTFLFLFTADEVEHTPVDLDDPETEPDYEVPVLALRSKAGVLADRLDVLGVSAGDLNACLSHGVDEQLAYLESLLDSSGGAEEAASAIADLKAMTFEVWVSRVRAALAGPPHYLDDPVWEDYTQLTPLMELWEDFDPRWLLRAVLEACDPDDPVVLDLTDLTIGGYLEQFDFDPQTAATVMFSYALANGTPAVVITEGSTDAEFLKAAIDIRRPHLANFIKFFEYGDVQGGVGPAINTVKAFAAAGVNNRVIVLLDNDTAAHDAVRGLRKVQLPSHYAVAHYPPIELAENYPSTGPTGAHVGDVNGKAGSVELYLGADVLTDPTTGTLRPVTWGARIAALSAYQGEISGKHAVHEAFRAKAAAAKEDPSLVAGQDWSGLDAILDALVDLLRTCGVPDPAQRQGFVR